MWLLIFCVICVIICVSIFGAFFGLIIGVGGCIIGLIAWSFISGPETRHEEMMDRLDDIRDRFDDYYDY